ncbi:MAG: hypothetical protein Q9224_005840, partial [Gallowayella concinna]
MLPPFSANTVDESPPSPAPDPKAVTVLCTPGTETFIKMTRSFPSDEFMTEKDSTETQQQLQSLIENTFTWIGRKNVQDPRHGDVIVHPQKDLVPILSRTSPHGQYQLQIFNAHRMVVHHRWSTLGHGTRRIQGKEVTWL